MRKIFIQELIKYTENDDNIIVLTADLGYNAFEQYRDRFPRNFINVGAAEANMVGLAAGLAHMGRKVCIYSIVPFITLRVFEQIRNDICADNYDIKLIGVGGGFSYGHQGISHHSYEDLALLKTLPNMIVYCPADNNEAKIATKNILFHNGPAYIRLGKNPEYKFTRKSEDFAIGEGIVINKGDDVSLISVGNILDVTLEVRKILQLHNISVRVISIPCLKPFDYELVLSSIKETKSIFTIEEHYINGGLGSAVAEIIAESGYKTIFKRFALMDQSYQRPIGSQEYLREKNGLSSDKISSKILTLL